MTKAGGTPAFPGSGTSPAGGTPALCASSCIDCLQTFRNAHYHRFLSRAAARERLDEWGRRLSFAHAVPPRARLRLVTPAADARYVRCMPLVPLAAAAGAFGDPHTVPEESDWEWVEVETARPLRRGMFVARVVGRSMEPAVPDGAWCLFASPVTGTRAGRVVLVRLDDALDPDTGQRFTVKRYRSEKTADEEGWRHLRITLSPDNPEFSPIEFEAEDEGSVAVVAELVEVIGPEPPAGGLADP